MQQQKALGPHQGTSFLHRFTEKTQERVLHVMSKRITSKWSKMIEEIKRSCTERQIQTRMDEISQCRRKNSLNGIRNSTWTHLPFDTLFCLCSIEMKQGTNLLIRWWRVLLSWHLCSSARCSVEDGWWRAKTMTKPFSSERTTNMWESDFALSSSSIPDFSSSWFFYICVVLVLSSLSIVVDRLRRLNVNWGLVLFDGSVGFRVLKNPVEG